MARASETSAGAFRKRLHAALALALLLAVAPLPGAAAAPSADPGRGALTVEDVAALRKIADRARPQR